MKAIAADGGYFKKENISIDRRVEREQLSGELLFGYQSCCCPHMSEIKWDLTPINGGLHIV